MEVRAGEKQYGGHWDRMRSSLDIEDSELYLGITINVNRFIMPGNIGSILNIISFF